MGVLSLCSGYGDLELILARALPDRTPDMVAVCDNYGPARTVLAACWVTGSCLLRGLSESGGH